MPLGSGKADGNTWSMVNAYGRLALGVDAAKMRRYVNHIVIIPSSDVRGATFSIMRYIGKGGYLTPAVQLW